jgi:hypothetical protein
MALLFLLLPKAPRELERPDVQVETAVQVEVAVGLELRVLLEETAEPAQFCFTGRNDI